MSNGNEAEEEHPIWIFSADRTNPAVTAVVTVTETDVDATVAATATAIDKHPARGCSKSEFLLQPLHYFINRFTNDYLKQLFH